MVIEHLCKHPQHCRLIFFDRTFNINIEQDRLGWDANAPFHHGIGYGIIQLVLKVIKSLPAIHLFVGEQIGKHL